MLWITIVLTLLNLVLIVYLCWQQKKDWSEILRTFFDDQFKKNREELGGALRENRMELSKELDKIRTVQEEKLQYMIDKIQLSGKESREELRHCLKDFSDSFHNRVLEMNELQKERFGQMTIKQQELVRTTENKLEALRAMVDEKLHKTLEERLGKSFTLVSDRLEAVQQGLGEMKNLASGVGDLKKVLSNVKMRGTLGEIQLGGLLEQVLAPEQFQANVRMKEGTLALVDFALKLPGSNPKGDPVWLPIDSKFPMEDFIRLQDAYERSEKNEIESCQKALFKTVKKSAKDIAEKYINPPQTTDFAILFLPTEGLYAELLRNSALVAQLQRDHKIVLTGPTTLAAMLNSLQVGFRTLAIQKRSSDVWEVLGAVKTEFSRFGGVLDKTQKKINDANDDLEKLIGTRTRMMIQKLQKVEALGETKSQDLLEQGSEN